MKVNRFEDLIAWQKARLLTRAVYQITKGTYFLKDASLANQMQRASVSVMANLAEGFERSSRLDFHRFIVIAKSSCAELRSHLYVALDSGYLTQDAFNKITEAATEVSKILGGLKKAVRLDGKLTP